jgi:nucleoside-triphosphatase THEP1
VDEGTPRLLLEGRPGIGKTTVARRLLTLLQEGGVPVAGFTTAELRTGRRREGFVVEAVSDAQEVLAHIDLPGPRLDMIVTDDQVITCRRTRRPSGILWEHLDDAKLAAIPILAARARRRARITP